MVSKRKKDKVLHAPCTQRNSSIKCFGLWVRNLRRKWWEDWMVEWRNFRERNLRRKWGEDWMVEWRNFRERWKWWAWLFVKWWLVNWNRWWQWFYYWWLVNRNWRRKWFHYWWQGFRIVEWR